MIPLSIIIPTFNGLENLKRLLPSLLNLMKEFYDHEVLIVDDGSQDRTEIYLKDQFPEVRTIVLGRNMGFARACNIGVSEARNGLVIILNNDVLIDSDFLSNTLSPVENPRDSNQKIFALTCKVLKEDRKTLYHFRNKGIFTKGEIVIYPLPEEKGNTFFASGVMMVFRKDLFLELGGFDNLYHPFYWEDVDICYRALKKGYKILYDPQSVIYHKDQGTTVFSKKGKLSLFFAKMYARIIQERNQYLFTWKNILDKDLILRHIQWIPIQLLLSFRNKDHIFKSIAFLFALFRLRKAWGKRREEKGKGYPLNDQQVLSIS